MYLVVPEMFFDEHGNGRKDDVVLKLQKSIYGLVQASHSWYYHLLDGLNKLDFKLSVEDPGMYFGRGMILITYVDDTLLFGPDLEIKSKLPSPLSRTLVLDILAKRVMHLPSLG